MSTELLPHPRARRGPMSLLGATVALFGLAVAGLVAAGPAAASDGPATPVDDTYNTDYETVLQVPAARGVLVNDDPGRGGVASIAIYGGSEGGFIQQLDSATGAFTFEPEEGFTGAATFVYRLDDAGAWSAVLGTVTITVGPVASRDDAYRLGVTQPTLTVAAPGIAANDLSAVGDTSTRLVSPTSHGTVALAADGSFTYAPTPGFAGVDTFTYVVVAGGTGATSATGTVTITVDPPNADLAVTMTAPPAPRRGNPFTLRVTVTGTGPSVARDVVVGVDVSRAFTVTAAPGGRIAQDRRTVGYTLPRLAVGATRVFELTVAVPADAPTVRLGLVGAVRSLRVADFVATNDRATLTVRPRATA